MRKGITRTIAMLGMLLLFIVSLLIFVSGFSNISTEKYEQPEATVNKCPDNCNNNLDGIKCLKIYQAGELVGQFCGCAQNSDCLGGLCDSTTRTCQ
ncbi:MAG: hypothetical protein PHU12_02925 [Candidatus Aenigmarchaeota archaeon]|nr:hypothetical protein [Candidatus Aenigmarchaeota archaeon]